MKFKKKELLLGILLGAGLNLLNSLRAQLPDDLDDIKTRVRDTYATAYDGVSRAAFVSGHQMVVNSGHFYRRFWASM